MWFYLDLLRVFINTQQTAGITGMVKTITCKPLPFANIRQIKHKVFGRSTDERLYFP